MTVHQTVASAAIRIETEGFNVADGIEAGLPKVRKAFEASVRLIEFYLIVSARARSLRVGGHPGLADTHSPSSPVGASAGAKP
jgi:hypothetical protein